MEETTQNQINNIKENLLEDIDLGENQEMFNAIFGLIGMPDEEFMVLAPGIMQSYQQTLNNPTDKIMLVQSLNAAGMKSEDLIEAFDSIEVEIDKLTLSVQKKDFLKEMLSTIINAITSTEGIAKRIIEVPIEFCREGVRRPEYAHITDSGMDVYALEDVTIAPGETKLIPTGIKIALPPGYELQVRPKSGRALKTKLRIANSPGTLDQGYRDEVGIIVDNIAAPIEDISYEFNDDGSIRITSIVHGRDYIIGKGEKFCQLVLAEVPKVSWYEVETVQEIGEDRGGGFGSTGLK